MAMLPNEYQPLVLSEAQQRTHRRLSAIGFKIAPRPFAGKGDHLWFFMSLVTPENPKGIEFTVNILNGVAHRTGTQTTYTIEEAEKEFGGATGERQGNFENPPSDASPAVPVAAAEAEPVKPPAEKPVASRAEPVQTHGGLTPSRSPEKSVAVKKKQTALF